MTEPDERTARRASIRHLLDRAERGRLLPAETAMLRAAVEVEQYNADHADATQEAASAAYWNAHDRAERAEQRDQRRGDLWKRKAKEIEADRDRADKALADAEQQLAEARHRIRILTAADEGRAAGAQRIINERDHLAREADRRSSSLAAILAKPRETPFDDLTEYAAKTLTRNGERLLAAEARAEQANGRAARAEERTQHAEAALARVRAECHAIKAEIYGQHDEDDDGKRAAADRIEATLDAPAVPEDACQCGHSRDQHTAGPHRDGCDYCTGCATYRPAEPDPAPCEQHPGASTIAGICAMCTQHPTPAPAECKHPYHRHQVTRPGPECQ